MLKVNKIAPLTTAIVCAVRSSYFNLNHYMISIRAPYIFVPCNGSSQ